MAEIQYFMRSVDAVACPRIVVRKGLRTLELYDGGVPVARVRAAIGRGEGPKRAEGDCKTPEGLYFVCVRNERSKYHLSLGVSYPNADDARRAFETGAITPEQRDAIVSAAGRRARPPWDTGLGGEIMIHGGGSRRDWTAGCVALDNDAMDFLWNFVQIGTEVEFLP